MLCWKCHCFANERVVVLSDIGRLSPQADLDTWVSPLTWSLTMTALTWKVLKNSWVLKSSPFPAVLIRVYMWLSTTVRVERRLNCERERWVQCSVTLGQGCLNSVLEGQCPAEFRSNLPQHTCREVSSMPSKSLISWFRCVWLGLELNSAGHRPSRTESGHPCSRAYSVCLIFNMDFLFYPLQITNPLSPIPTFLFPSLLCQGNRGFFCLNYIFRLSFSPHFFFLACFVPPQGMWCCDGPIIGTTHGLIKDCCTVIFILKTSNHLRRERGDMRIYHPRKMTTHRLQAHSHPTLSLFPLLIFMFLVIWNKCLKQSNLFKK